MLSSISDSTLSQYNTTFKMWWEFCIQEKYSVFKSGVREVIAFLQFILNTKTHKYGTFNSHRSALSLLLPGNIGEDLCLKRFMKGIYNLRPAAPRYNVTWDTQLVINFLEKMSSLEDLSLKDLSLKLSTLLILLTGQRVQTLFWINIDNIVETSNGLQIFIVDKIKTSGYNKPQPCLEIPCCTNNPALCAVTLLKFYIEKTKDVRKNNQKYLFISTRFPHSRASKDTISRWIKETLYKAGVDKKFTSHSTRHASTSKALHKGVPLDVIRKTAGWSDTSQVFEKYYHRPIINSSSMFARAILS